MKRNITIELEIWKKKKNRKPLIIRGARQVGKSYSILDFGKTHFKGRVHVVNFEKNPDWHSIFERNYDLRRILSELEILLNAPIIPGQDLLFFDEIQECPKALIALRYFYEQLPELHVIAAGSLLEFALKEITFPVGRVQLMSMHPMNFYEFLLATGKNHAAKEILKAPGKIADSIHLLITEELRNYFFIGGMPECVNAYCNGRMNDVFEIQSDLLLAFRQDFSKYAGHADKNCLNAVLSGITQKIGQQIKYTGLADGFSTPTINKAFHLLETARLIKMVHAADPSGIPLGAHVSEKIFKAIFLDIGLLSRLSGLSVATEFHKTQLLSLFRGCLAEQFIGQEILAAGNDELFYWSRRAKSSSAETDYLVERKDEIIPVEVKSGASGSLKSLHLLLNTYPNIRRAWVFSDSAYSTLPAQKLTFIPLYLAYSAFSH
jgi:predicted AAA+ superfamily ATPase